MQLSLLGSESEREKELQAKMRAALEKATAPLLSGLFNHRWTTRKTRNHNTLMSLRAMPRKGDCTSVLTPTALSYAESHQPGTNRQIDATEKQFAAVPTPNAMEGGQTSRSGKRKGEPLMGQIARMMAVPTPQAHDDRMRGNTMADHHSYPHDLPNAMELCGVPTPNCPTGGPNTKSTPTHTGGMDLDGVALLMAVATPRAEDSESTGAHRGTPDTLTSQARLTSVPTPSANEYEHSDIEKLNARRERCKASHKNGNGFGMTLGNTARLLASGPTPSGSLAPTASSGQLNPAYSRWLMGLPPAWDDCAVTAMQSWRSRRKRLSRRG